MKANVQKQGVPEGYKQTQIGAIPADWEVMPVSKAFNICNNLRLPLSAKVREGMSGIYPYYGPTKIQDYISEYRIEGEYALMGEDGDHFLKYNTVDQTQLATGKFNVNNHAHLIKGNIATAKWFFWFFRNRDISNALTRQGAGRYKLNKATLAELPCVVPSKVEQDAITSVLSDVDVLISELEKLIAKKQAIKTATMQQLLTGKKRLPQFAKNEDGTLKGYKESELGDIPEDWDVIDFGELFEESIAKNIPKGTEVVTFLGMQDVSENAQLLNQSLIRYSKVKSGFTYFEKGDVLVAKITPCFENGKGCHTENLGTQVGFGSTEFHVLRAKGNSDSKFVYFWTTRKSFRVDLEAEMVGSAGHRRVPLSALSSYKIPSSLVKEEQTAIAEILTDMEADVQALEQRLAKTRQIKQGMMQELLTGKTRLVKPESK
ncbi:restriction endonuclease subunit S [Shewanella insulae]|uniref:restriction endonuclease subunit S n=1 Tax=Shewanella insulae TaxID=2681496 RepID=UPI001EFCB87D|nr:restriction endonuclease subunit S [Shewanella insulae]MCG9737683.1 restriction endonuclease subunit S [Shewanella insulae]